MKHGYRSEIDGIRALCAWSVVAYHLGTLSNGWLGVDSFFVLSGYLITSIMVANMDSGSFSYREFYSRRFRRIMPLTTAVTLATLAFGFAVMLPDDLQNLGQSAFATMAFSNNFLLAVTSKDYWGVANEFKPLLHTWSLGIEEQYYIIAPIAMGLAFRSSFNLLKSVLICTTVISLALFVSGASGANWQFYGIHTRYWEMGLGALCAVARMGQRARPGAEARFALGLLGLGACLFWPFRSLSVMWGCPAAAIATCIIVGNRPAPTSTTHKILRSPLFRWSGTRSFSIYMWHQPVIAYGRYSGLEMESPVTATAAAILTAVLAEGSYRIIEERFRFAHRMRPAQSIITTACGMFLAAAAGLWLHSIGGVVRDVPELGYVAGESHARMHAEYNERIREICRPDDRKSEKTLVIVGNSQARDWANVLDAASPGILSSVAYYESVRSLASQGSPESIAEVHLVGVNSAEAQEIYDSIEDSVSVVIVGPKRFGDSMGRWLGTPPEEQASCSYKLGDDLLSLSRDLRMLQATYFVDLIDLLSVGEYGSIRVFTPGGHLISQDGVHLTPQGALYVSRVVHSANPPVMGFR